MSGALGNVIDRLRFGYVVDFIGVHWNDAWFPAFNVADSCITVGAGLLLLDDACSNGGQRRGRTVERMKILLASPRGFCAGVDRAIDIVERAIELFGAPIYVRHEVVHNRHVVERLRALGARFVEELDEVPAGATLIFSAHGVSSAVEERGERARFPGVRCDLSAGDQGAPGSGALRPRRARRGADRSRRPSGSRGHDGPVRCPSFGGHDPPGRECGGRARLQVRNPETLAFVTQTTLSVDDTPAIVQALRDRFPEPAGAAVEDICYATQNRQDAVKRLLQHCDVLVVVGSATSSNSNRLRELAERAGMPGYLVDGPDNLQREWFAGKRRRGRHGRRIGARIAGAAGGASGCAEWGGESPDEIVGREENVVFSLPRALRVSTPTAG